MKAYLNTHPPVRRQFRPRRKTVSGAIVIHTAENVADEVGPDSGAENVARFIRKRNNPGSYHVLVDSDSILQLIDFEKCAFGEGTGGNDFAIHISVAMQASKWNSLREEWRTSTMDRLVLACVRAEDFVRKQTGVIVPRHRITPQQYRATQPGYIAHGDLDPKRRSDPGVDFDWAYLFSGLNGKATMTNKSVDLGLYTDLLAAYTVGGRCPTPEEVDGWLPDLRAKLSRNEPLTPTFSWIAHTVAKEGK